MRKLKLFPFMGIFLIVGFLLLAGCWPGTQQTVDSDKTPFQIAQEQVQKIADAYVYVYDKTDALAKDPNITESEKKLVVANKAILAKVWPHLVKCQDIISNGGIPSKIDLDTADDILDLIEGAIQ
jgi:hypothetical protein